MVSPRVATLLGLASWENWLSISLAGPQGLLGKTPWAGPGAGASSMQPTHQASLRPNELQLATELGAGRREGHPLLGKQGCPGLPRRIPVLYWLEALSWELPGVSQRVTGGRLSWDSAPAAERRLQEVWDPQTRLTAVCPFPDDLFTTSTPAAPGVPGRLGGPRAGDFSKPRLRAKFLFSYPHCKY